MSKSKYKNIMISDKNYFILKRLGNTGESYNDVLSRVLKEKMAGLQYT